MQWYEKNPDRLAIEGTLLRQSYPEAQLVKLDNKIRVRVQVQGRLARYRCELAYPRNFPWDQMRVRVLSPELRPSPHQLSNNSLCVCHSEDVGPETTALVYMEWLKGWISRYEEYLQSGNWRC